MERMSFERLEPRIEEKKRSFLENSFGLETEAFERISGLDVRKLTRYEYIPFEAGFRQVDTSSSRRPIEVMWSAEQSTLVVPPPVSGRPVTMGELAQMTLPVVDFIKQQEPDIVIGCDRGARIYSFAVYSMWSKRNGARFPTLDGCLDYARLSKSLPQKALERALAEILKANFDEGRRQDRNYRGDRPKLMFIDDWISSGATREHILKALKALGLKEKVQVIFVVMCGEGADATGTTRRVHVPWHDDPETVGVNYNSQGIGYGVRTIKSRTIRHEVRSEVRKIAKVLERKGN